MKSMLQLLGVGSLNLSIKAEPNISVMHTECFSMHDGIVDGKVSVPHSRPYMVYIRDKLTKISCGGFLVKEDYVMTAAHCKHNHLMVYLGVDNTNILPDGIEVKPIPHENFTMKRPDHDIMLLKLKSPATLNETVNTITLPKTENEEISKHCMVMGWGWQDYNNMSPSNVLKEANVTLIDSENCGTADTLCTEGSTGPAQGDSGGPLVCGGVVQGIVSFNKNSINGDKLAVYTHISHYLPWIKDNMKPLQQRQYETWKGKLDKIIESDLDEEHAAASGCFSMHDGIVGGKVSVPHSRPYMVYIRDKLTKMSCGGFLVREDYVMTAAHCKHRQVKRYLKYFSQKMNENDSDHLMVYLGVNDTNLLPNGIEVDPIPHPEFNMGREGHDIMLLKLKTPVTLNKTVSTITLEKTVNEEISKDCMVMGWGWEKYHHRSPSDVLKEATVTLIDSKNCGTADTLCNEGSTGPAKFVEVLHRELCHITKKKYNEEYLSVYTLISHYLPWIKANMKPLHQQQYETWKGKLDKIIVTELSTMSILWYITCLLLLHSCTPGFCKHDGIVCGKVSVPHSRLYMVYICDKLTKIACGGFLVREDFVMTAAHCKHIHLMVYLGVDDTNFLPDGVELSTMSILWHITCLLLLRSCTPGFFIHGIVGGKVAVSYSQPYMVYIRDKVDPIPHPEFTMTRAGHDIMLLKLKTPATSNKIVSTITLPKTENEEISKKCMVRGWGWKKYHQESPSNVLKEANVNLIDSENCGTADTLCTEGSTGPGPRDSGGPLVCGGVAQGIVLFSKNKANADYLTVYTNISHYLTWIHRTMMSSEIPKILLPDGVEVDPIPHSKFKRNKIGHDIMLLKRLAARLGLAEEAANRLLGLQAEPLWRVELWLIFALNRSKTVASARTKLKTPATLTKTVSSITLLKPKNEKISKDCMVMGWGWKKYNHESPSNVLKEATVTLTDSEICGTADTLCTEGSTRPAQRDSGGPLVCGGVAQGIVSFYKNNTDADHLTVYTHISHYFTWIHRTMMSSEIPKMSDQAYMVYIRDKLTKRSCGGFLVREDFVMTAASCKHSHLMVYLGVDNTNFLPDGIEVKPIPHPEFTMKRPDHDIMLLKLKTPATLNKIVSTITLPKTVNEEISKNCMGWQDYNNMSPSNVLKEANVTLIDSENCGTADTLCTEGSTGPARVCQDAPLTDDRKCISGDSGGPLVCGGVVQGIVSFYKNSINGDKLAVYTHISHYLPWIKHTMLSPDMAKRSDQSYAQNMLLNSFMELNSFLGFSMLDGTFGAEVSVPHSRPYMVYIRDKYTKVACSGFLVREDYVMTAAHCKQSHLTVYLGVNDTNLLPDGIELKTPATLNLTVNTITFPNTENEEISKNCIAIVWAWMKYHDESPSNVLKEANVTLIDSENCGTTDTLCTEGSTGPAQAPSRGRRSARTATRRSRRFGPPSPPPARTPADSPASSYRSATPTIPPIEKWTMASLKLALAKSDVQPSRKLNKAELYELYKNLQPTNRSPEPSPASKRTKKTSKPPVAPTPPPSSSHVTPATAQLSTAAAAPPPPATPGPAAQASDWPLPPPISAPPPVSIGSELTAQASAWPHRLPDSAPPPATSNSELAAQASAWSHWLSHTAPPPAPPNPTFLRCTLSVTELSTMSILWYITCLLLLGSCTPGFFIHGIVGGKVSVPHSHPYMVYIRDKLTKIHLMVYLGVDNTNILPDGIEVDPIPHEDFTMKRPDHDIMLLKLKTPATLKKTVSTITLSKTESEEISKDCMVMGWGWQDYNNMSPSNVLKEVNVTLIDSENCGTADTLCTEGSTGPAQGDAGGPLVCGGVAEGIASFYKKNEKGEYLPVYTHISQYLPWIQHITGGKDSVPHSRPYMVYIRDKVSKVACSGFLVKEDFVMTAAHCKQR
ncbi:Mast cell protease 8 [Labeo rohita]|uniref:Mast cell protease 8 n=1 Tax=Labeo rohita TaxID=84645 RepID=A0ABQ8LJ50_LABRO|nr:Mast cell protease 8 [Labeo rohita]